jgi:hypothetical protein
MAARLHNTTTHRLVEEVGSSVQVEREYYPRGGGERPDFGVADARFEHLSRNNHPI